MRKRTFAVLMVLFAVAFVGTAGLAFAADAAPAADADRMSKGTITMEQVLRDGGTVGWIIIVPPFIAMWNTANHVQALEERLGIRQTLEPAIVIVIMLVFVLANGLYVQEHLNRAWDAASSGGRPVAAPPPPPLMPPAPPAPPAPGA